MFSAFIAPLFTLLNSLPGTWEMRFPSVHFLLFLPVAVAVYFILPKNKLRAVWLLLASYYFYLFAAPVYLPVLLLGTLGTYLLGFFVGIGKKSRTRHICLVFAVAACVFTLSFFKYNEFLFSGFLAPLLAGWGVAYSPQLFSSAAVLGISYYTFTALGYLIDIARGDILPEKNLLDYALFLGFFPSVTMGPISRSGGLLPQLKDNTRRFNPDTAAGALLLMATGFFKKMAVADTLNLFTKAVYASPEALQSYSGLTLALAAFIFMLQLYFDFSGYSDIAMGAAQLLGIQIPQNFANPYFSTNFSGFWARWHMSLSCWLQDYIFTPLVWSRWPEKLPVIGKKITAPPVLSSIATVFLISGLWHGDTFSFFVWGALQAAFRIGEELLHRTIGKPKKRLPLWQRAGKIAIVLTLWAESLVFFRVGMMPGGRAGDALSALGRQFTGLSLTQTANDIFAALLPPMLDKAILVYLLLAFSLFCLAVALAADWWQCFHLRGKRLDAAIRALPAAGRWAVYLLLVLLCFAAFLLQNGGFTGASFLYNQF